MITDEMGNRAFWKLPAIERGGVFAEDLFEATMPTVESVEERTLLQLLVRSVVTYYAGELAPSQREEVRTLIDSTRRHILNGPNREFGRVATDCAWMEVIYFYPEVKTSQEERETQIILNPY